MAFGNRVKRFDADRPFKAQEIIYILSKPTHTYKAFFVLAVCIAGVVLSGAFNHLDGHAIRVFLQTLHATSTVASSVFAAVGGVSAIAAGVGIFARSRQDKLGVIPFSLPPSVL